MITITNRYYSILNNNYRIILNKDNKTVDFIKNLSKKPEILTIRYNNIFYEVIDEIKTNIFFIEIQNDFLLLLDKLIKKINDSQQLYF